jgi:hypothetical protein
MKILKQMTVCLVTLVALTVCGIAKGNAPVRGSAPELFRKHLADYDSELRRPDARVDVDAMVTRLKELGVTAYYWLIWHAATDWEGG